MTISSVPQLIAIVLYVIANVPINTHKNLYQAPRVDQASRMQSGRQDTQTINDRIGPGDPGSSRPTPDVRLRAYMYRFEGRTLYKGQPVSGAKVILRLTTSRVSIVQTVLSAEDGSYQFRVRILGSRHEPVDFAMNAYTPDAKNMQFAGRRIVMQEDDEAITVLKTLDLNSEPGA